jgi:excisionase family DNA binding protein
MAIADELMTISQAAGRLGVSARRIRQLIQAGRLRAAQVGGRWLILAEDVAGHRRLGPGGRPRKRAPAEPDAGARTGGRSEAAPHILCHTSCDDGLDDMAEAEEMEWQIAQAEREED